MHCLNYTVIFGFLFLFIGFMAINAAERLQRYNVDPATVTVSGISSGAAMATQFHFAHSKEVHGAGLVAGVPYCCGIGGLVAALTCMETPALVNVDFLISEARSLERSGYIDPTSNVAGDNVFVFHGSADSTVRPHSGQNVVELYQSFGANIRTEFTYAAEHGWPTNNYGAACGSNSASTGYFNNCNYKGAFEILDFLYGGSLINPNDGTGNINNLKEFSQSEFFALHPSFSSMDTVGFVYVPSACASGTRCRFHISFHGCQQSRGNIGNSFPVRSQLMDVAEANNIIVLFPQIAATAVNLASCWDWFGYLNIYFPTRNGNQVLATYRMMTRVISG